jgi:hypothetical protein
MKVKIIIPFSLKNSFQILPKKLKKITSKNAGAVDDSPDLQIRIWIPVPPPIFLRAPASGSLGEFNPDTGHLRN